MKDRIVFLKCLHGVPMFAYDALNDCGMEYRSDKIVGKHLYEFTERDNRDWRNLPDLLPYSENQNPTLEIEERAELYDEAVERGIVRLNPTSDYEYQIVVWPSIDDIVLDAVVAIGSRNMVSIKASVDAIDTYKDTKKPVCVISIINDGAPGHEAKVRKDHVVASKEMSDVIKKEIDKENKLEEILKSLTSAKNSEGMMAKENFFNALYSGVIVVNIPKVAFGEEKYGMTNEVVLSDPKMEPAGKFVPLYQAYLTYSVMTDEDKAKISNQTEERLSDVGAWQAAMQDSCDRLLEIFSDCYIGLMQQQAMKLPNLTKEIIDLLIEFKQGIEGFKRMYGLA